MLTLAVSSPGAMTAPLSQPNSFHSQEPIRIEHLQSPTGEGAYCCDREHTVFISLASRPVHYRHTQDGKTHTGLYRQGDLLITPANTPLFTRWEGNEDCLQIQIPAEFIQHIARETLDQDSDRLELVPIFQTRDAQIAAIATLLLPQLSQNSASSQLYMDSLSNVLAINLLRQHATTRPQLCSYEGGLPQRQLAQVLDYINTCLDQEIRLAHLAQLLDMSQFHFSRLFKQSLGVSPHQYLLQQRVERAKRLLKQTDKPIVDIAFECGFNSHSHLSKQFRQLTGMAPKGYRLGQ